GMLIHWLGTLDMTIRDRIRAASDRDLLARWFDDALVLPDIERARQLAEKIQKAVRTPQPGRAGTMRGVRTVPPGTAWRPRTRRRRIGRQSAVSSARGTSPGSPAAARWTAPATGAGSAPRTRVASAIQYARSPLRSCGAWATLSVRAAIPWQTPWWRG